MVPQKILTYLAMMLAVPLAGEMKFYPLEGILRVSLGTPVFFFFLLWSRKIHPLLSGFLVGVSVVAFRILSSVYISDVALQDSFEMHFPVFFYYLSFAWMFQYFQLKKHYDNPLLLGMLGVIIEILASIMELTARSLFIHVSFSIKTLVTISGIAIIRSFFVLGFFNITVIREARAAEREQRIRNEKMLMLISNLYVEMIQLRKMMKNAEQLTSDCYSLYRGLREDGNGEYARAALRIAGAMHETKKDSQRIYAGLSKLMTKENLSDFLFMREIVDVIVTSNESYAQLLGKDISFEIDLKNITERFHTFLLLSIINNLVSNAVEAIKGSGIIRMEAELKGNLLILTVKDSGPGINTRNKPLIFEPGFTTKFNQDGIASNGIGLSYIKNVIESHDGKIELIEGNVPFNTIFHIELPVECLIERG
ncbi:sensor histidine kinase [Bacillus massilinigeriensis]|uniref:sensor histidine kinase n=1 Tax=Bacillus mediterraneensis TaxID=1805474 RepID=UPI0008F8068C|nr:sensor histidine kinase [Bacillus mediterraneensis]